jgi:hypothetical protein
MSDGTSEDTTESVQIEEVKCYIRDLPFVTKLSPVRAQRPVEETGIDQRKKRVTEWLPRPCPW